MSQNIDQAPPQHQPQRVRLKSNKTIATHHQYACLRCRSRRVKCDKTLTGCAHCAAHRQPCVYSARRPRKSHKSTKSSGTTTASLARKILLPANPASSLSCIPALERRSDSEETTVDGTEWDSSGQALDDGEEEEAVVPQDFRNSAYRVQTCTKGGDRLLIDSNGGCHFVGSEKVEQVMYCEQVLRTHPQEAGGELAIKQNPKISRNLDPNALLSASLYNEQDTSVCHPPADIMHVLWNHFVQNVDIMAKVIYKPAVFELIQRAANNRLPSNLGTDESLLFAIWLASAITLTPTQCAHLTQTSQQTLLQRYTQALTHSLHKHSWPTTQTLSILQALTLYLIFSPENARATWMLSGMALSIAQAMGMHTDGSSYPAFSVIETEVRRRVWWTLCQLDVRISENCGLQSHVPFFATTKMPLHINDSDLSSCSSDGTVQERDRFSEMTPSLIKIEMAWTGLRVRRVRSFSSSSPSSAENEEDIRQIIQTQITRYRTKYLPYFFPSSSSSSESSQQHQQSEIHRLSELGTHLIIARLQKLQFDHSTTTSSALSREEQLLQHNTAILQIAHALPQKYKAYGWFFRCAYSKWHAVAYLLVQLCKISPSPSYGSGCSTSCSTKQRYSLDIIQQAYTTIDAAFAEWGGNTSTNSQENQRKSGPSSSSSYSPSSTSPEEKEAKAINPRSSIYNPLLQLYSRAQAVRSSLLIELGPAAPAIEYPISLSNECDSNPSKSGGDVPITDMISMLDNENPPALIPPPLPPSTMTMQNNNNNALLSSFDPFFGSYITAGEEGSLYEGTGWEEQFDLWVQDF
ncbi:unnamed protein product [Periconia digitata]|uniref:Zn(2)-C6 fungal-type domain-containing protein n=1 Tax=Periconia digitata TaxID=1303443 RepID=A0A9W4U1V1_9PLEO|nr:unnamed protein product [Periconia digitata]